MESKHNYFLVGVFITLGTALLFAFAVWLASGHDKRKYHPYHIYFTESVTGLNPGAAVRYRGVQVGQVQSIEIDEEDDRRILITASIAEGTPLRADTTASLKFQGITGVSYVDLSAGTSSAVPIKPDDRHPPTITSAPSQLEKVVNRIPEVADKISALADKLNAIASDENVAHVSHTLANLDAITSSFGSNAENLQQLVASMNAAMANIAQAAGSIGGLAKDSREDIRQTLAEANHTIAQMGELVEQTNQFSQTGFKETQSLVLELKKTSRQVEDLSRQLKENPSQLLYPVKEQGEALP